ncbi:MAG: alpha/beta hydrolase, partial [Dehalococcoidia bacterium]
MSQQPALFPCGELTLEGVWHLPDGEGPFPAVVVCHPHPLYGGDMHSSVVVTVSHTLAQKSIIVFRFNFRGVGRSQGSYAEGIGEQKDVRSALFALASDDRVATGRIGLAGYSFGAGVALPVAPEDERVVALAAISPPPQALEPLKDYPRPKLILVGSEDAFMPPEELERLAGELPQPTRFEIVNGPDHFWWGYEGQAAQMVADFFAEML